MTFNHPIPALLIITALLYVPAAHAQTDDSAEQQAVETVSPQNDKTSSSAEVEINEDNYRRYMELRDQRTQRNNLPVDAYQSRASLQKLDKLPEDSQKHLRDQLREIIMQGDQWKPGDELIDHPYVSSEAARNSQPLQRLEAEAWDELVSEYHQREAQIFENSSRSKAAMANASTGTSGSEGSSQSDSEQASGHDSGDGQNSSQGGGEQSDGRAQASQNDRAEQSDPSASYSPNSAENPNAISTAGVSQNAMEFLMGKRGQGSQSGNRQPSSSQNPAGGQQQSSSSGLPALPEIGTQSVSRQQSPQTEGNSTPGSGETDTSVTYRSNGTLSIQDLVNAKGVTDSTEPGTTGSGPAPLSPVDKQEDDEVPPGNRPDGG